MTKQELMRRAIALAVENVKQGGGPFGAVIARNGEIVAEGIFVLDGERRLVKRGDVMNIPVEHYHAIKATTDLTFIEVQLSNPLVEEDIERFEY